MPCIDLFQFGSVKSLNPRPRTFSPLLAVCSGNAQHHYIRTCFIDFSKAFDRIDHNILMQKLYNVLLNVPPVLLNWCLSFLQGTQQRVKFGTCKSNWKEIKAGVPQGT